MNTEQSIVSLLQAVNWGDPDIAVIRELVNSLIEDCHAQAGKLTAVQAALDTAPSKDRNWSPEDSMGNYDDVFYDGVEAGEYRLASCIRLALQIPSYKV